MKIAILFAGAIAGMVSTSASAQTSDDDVRCLMVSAAYSRGAKTEDARRASAMTGAFFLGRLTSRMNATALSAAIKAQGKGLSAAKAEPIMRACIARAAAAEKQMATAAKQAQTAK